MAQSENVYTFTNIQKRKLATVPDSLDKREGSVIYTTIAANSMEMALAYMQLQINQNNYFPDTADRENLIRHCALRGITPEPATQAKVLGLFYSDVTQGIFFNPNIGDRFTVEDTTLTYTVTKQISDGNWELTCDTAGSVGNLSSGLLVPVDEIQSLGSANIISIINTGEDEEDTEVLRSRYMQSLVAQPFAGNKSAYRDLVKSVEDVGACKVYRAYDYDDDGEANVGHVGLCILNDDLNVASNELVSTVQKVIDPTQDGEGVGYAPIDHICHVFSASEKVIDVRLKITPVNSSTTWENISQSITKTIDDYFKSLKTTWDISEPLVVRPAQIIARVLGITAILDVTECSINGGTGNIQLTSNEIPKVGVVSGEIV